MRRGEPAAIRSVLGKESDRPLLVHALTATAEFAHLCAWLGCCRIVRQVAIDTDLVEFPGSALEMEFAFGVRCLVHVKVKAANNLSFRIETLEPLARHASRLGVPLLIAWKRYSQWKLVDAAELRMADGVARLRHDEAARQNLMGLLAGDQGFHLEPGSGVQLMLVPQLRNGDCNELGIAPQILLGLGAGGCRLPRFPKCYRQMLAFVPLERRRLPDDGGIRFEAREAIGFVHQFVVAAINHGRPDPRFVHARLLGNADGDQSPVMPSLAEIQLALDEARRDGLVAGVFRPSPFNRPGFLS